MGILIKKGSLGTFSGRVGSLVVSKWRDKTVAKDPPGKRKKKRKVKGETPPKQEQSLRLGLVTHFLSPFKEYIRIGLERKTRKNPAFQTAVERNLKKAVLGKYPNFTINYQKAIFSEGDLDMAWGTTLELTGPMALRITWEVPETSKIKLTGRDEACCMLYSEKKQKLVTLTGETAYRGDFEMRANFSQLFLGHTLHAWIFFVSPDGKSVSNTRYAGTVQVPEKKVAAPAIQETLPT
ncbi:hypothetical protein SAMN06265348_11612 [Pedobacter westerhofensis]|uniref:Uncharacterized protein n=1 Tax=Pedobacter westerhofensis TaxID=425512 RepID=A0A521FPT4_9SPHI|nr:DUF6266 family protein [Pedobacter westerhofensis]SMO98237.1 hypothetical protein SAMN06265348_11612 [Pedobacter westerhofensis]